MKICSTSKMSVVESFIYNQHDDSLCRCETIEGPPNSGNIGPRIVTPQHDFIPFIIAQQEIWNTFQTQQSFCLPSCLLSEYTIWDMTNEKLACDSDWSKRILIWFTEIVKFFFNESKFMTHSCRSERWKTLEKSNSIWEKSLPPEITPLFTQETDPKKGILFPVIWYKSSCQAITAQHIQLSRMLLAMSNPNISFMGLNARSEFLSMEKNICHFLRGLIGLALSNPKCPVVSINAAIGIFVGGGYLTAFEEQKAVLEFLIDLEFRCAWSTKTIIEALEGVWWKNTSHLSGLYGHFG